MKVTIYHAEECDRRKCTSIRLARRGKIKIVTKLNKLTTGAIVLDPFSEKALSPEDRKK